MDKIFDESIRVGYGIANIGWQKEVEESLGISNLIPFGYISAYKDSADDLVESVIKTELKNSYVFPIVFLYRQYTELLLKNIYFRFVQGTVQSKSSYIKKHGHKLSKIWEKVKPLLKQGPYLKKDIKCIENLINEFEKYDKNSFNFRYYANKDSTPTLPGTLSVNLKLLKDMVDNVDAILYSTYG